MNTYCKRIADMFCISFALVFMHSLPTSHTSDIIVCKYILNIFSCILRCWTLSTSFLLYFSPWSLYSNWGLSDSRYVSIFFYSEYMYLYCTLYVSVTRFIDAFSAFFDSFQILYRIQQHFLLKIQYIL